MYVFLSSYLNTCSSIDKLFPVPSHRLMTISIFDIEFVEYDYKYLGGLEGFTKIQ